MQFVYISSTVKICAFFFVASPLAFLSLLHHPSHSPACYSHYLLVFFYFISPIFLRNTQAIVLKHTQKKNTAYWIVYILLDFPHMWMQALYPYFTSFFFLPIIFHWIYCSIIILSILYLKHEIKQKQKQSEMEKIVHKYNFLFAVAATALCIKIFKLFFLRIAVNAE